jgi:hypothetical protein
VQIDRLREQLRRANERAARYRAERDTARLQRDANASQVAYLDEQNRLLRRQVGVARVVAPVRTGGPPPDEPKLSTPSHRSTSPVGRHANEVGGPDLLVDPPTLA